MRTALYTIKKLLRAFSGALGGIVAGIILSLILIHLKGHFSINLPSLKILIPLALFFSIIAGIVVPRFFMMFFLCPISWLLNSDDSGGGHPSGDFDTTWPDFLLNVSYMLGLILLAVGALFSLPWIAGIGILGIVIFSVGMFRLQHNTKGEQADAGNRAKPGA